jgi:hypothetical protein
LSGKWEVPDDLDVELSSSKHDLVAVDVLLDGVSGQGDVVGVEEFGAELRDRPMPGKAALSNPGEDVPANPPVGRSNGQFSGRAEGTRPRRAMAVGTVNELADQFERSREGIKVAAVVADGHLLATTGTGTVLKNQLHTLPDEVRRPGVQHRFLSRGSFRFLPSSPRLPSPHTSLT